MYIKIDQKFKYLRVIWRSNAELVSVLNYSSRVPAYLRPSPSPTAMKLKQQPEDFQVEERTDVQPSQQGDFALYRLEKSNWTTPDALGIIRRRWQVLGGRLSYGGLKSRHAPNSQYLTIFPGP